MWYNPGATYLMHSFSDGQAYAPDPFDLSPVPASAAQGRCAFH